jgi:hypothetical protein
MSTDTPVAGICRGTSCKRAWGCCRGKSNTLLHPHHDFLPRVSNQTRSRISSVYLHKAELLKVTQLGANLGYACRKRVISTTAPKSGWIKMFPACLMSSFNSRPPRLLIRRGLSSGFGVHRSLISGISSSQRGSRRKGICTVGA